MARIPKDTRDGKWVLTDTHVDDIVGHSRSGTTRTEKRKVNDESFFKFAARRKGDHKNPTGYARGYCKMVHTPVLKRKYLWGYTFDTWPTTDTIWAGMRVNPIRSYVDAPFYTTYADAATTRALAQINSASIDLGATIAESAQTANWAITRSFDLANALLALKKGNLRKFRKHIGDGSRLGKQLKRETRKRFRSKKLAERWLEYRYAVLPAVYDIDGARELMNEGLRKPIEPAVHKAFGIHTVSHQGTKRGTYNTQLSYNYKQSYKSTVRMEISNVHLSGLHALGISTVPGALWEIVPFSFCVDWLADVSGWLRASAALSPVSGLKRLSCWVTVKTTDTCTVTALPSSFLGHGKLKFKSFERRKHSLPKIAPSLNIQNPFSENTHRADALALFVSRAFR